MLEIARWGKDRLTQAEICLSNHHTVSHLSTEEISKVLIQQSLNVPLCLVSDNW
jgi:hypothetical protein